MIRPGRTQLAIRYTALIVLAAGFLLPFYVIVRNAFSSQPHITAATWHWWPDQLNATNIVALLDNHNLNIVKALTNSAIVAVLQTAGTVLVSLLAGWAMAAWSNRAAKILLGATVFTLMVPAAATFIPMFVMTAQLGWIDSYRGLIIPGMFSAFATYLFRQSFLDFPTDLTDAAAIDGANPWTAFWRVVVPNSMGIIGAVGTITFIGAWNAFLWPMLISREATRTAQVALSQFMTSQGVKYPELFMGALVTIVPVVGVFLFLQRYLVQGLVTSGLK